MQRRSPHRKKLIVGVTGSFGSGKTTVSKFFKSYQAQLIDADKLAHQCIKRGKVAYKKIVSAFGKDALKKDKNIDRRKLADIVFAHKDLLRRLNSIIHPEVIAAIKSKIKQSRGRRLIILDAPLLIEADLKKIVDKLVVVKLTQDKQIKRIRKTRNLSRIDILKRIRAQAPLRQKVRLADFVIDNSGTLRETKKEVAEIRRRLWKN